MVEGGSGSDVPSEATEGEVEAGPDPIIHVPGDEGRSVEEWREQIASERGAATHQKQLLMMEREKTKALEERINDLKGVQEKNTEVEEKQHDQKLRANAMDNATRLAQPGDDASETLATARDIYNFMKGNE